MVTDLKVRIACGLVPSLPHSTSYAPTSHTPVIHPSRVVPGLVFFFFFLFFFSSFGGSSFYSTFFFALARTAVFSSLLKIRPFSPSIHPVPLTSPLNLPQHQRFAHWCACVLCVCVCLLAFFLLFFPLCFSFFHSCPQPTPQTSLVHHHTSLLSSLSSCLRIGGVINSNRRPIHLILFEAWFPSTHPSALPVAWFGKYAVCSTFGRNAHGLFCLSLSLALLRCCVDAMIRFSSESVRAMLGRRAAAVGRCGAYDRLPTGLSTGLLTWYGTWCLTSHRCPCAVPYCLSGCMHIDYS
ncbi:hypothetical protein IWX48DRAFT_459182 [Phyllosticta citricarpa]